VLISDGRVRAVGPVQEVMGRADLYPLAGRFEAGAVLGVHVAAHDPRWSLTELAGSFGKLVVPRLDVPVGTALRVRIRARDVILAVTQPTGISALNVLAGQVEKLVPIEEEGALEVQLRVGKEHLLARVTRRSGEALGLAPGHQVFALIKTIAIDRRTLSRQGETADLEGDAEAVFDS
jgi:molybdate transport system ATP-binding protein